MALVGNQGGVHTGPGSFPGAPIVSPTPKQLKHSPEQEPYLNICSNNFLDDIPVKASLSPLRFLRLLVTPVNGPPTICFIFCTPSSVDNVLTLNGFRPRLHNYTGNLNVNPSPPRPPDPEAHRWSTTNHLPLQHILVSTSHCPTDIFPVTVEWAGTKVHKQNAMSLKSTA